MRLSAVPAFLPLAAAALVAACASAPSGGVPDASFENSYWRLVELNGQPSRVADNQREPHLRFMADSGRVTGSTGCNRLAGPYTRDGESLRFGPIISTRMACADPAMNQQEQAFMAALTATTRHAIAGDTLTLSGASGPVARLAATVMR